MHNKITGVHMNVNGLVHAQPRLELGLSPNWTRHILKNRGDFLKLFEGPFSGLKAVSYVSASEILPKLRDELLREN